MNHEIIKHDKYQILNKFRKFELNSKIFTMANLQCGSDWFCNQLFII